MNVGLEQQVLERITSVIKNNLKIKDIILFGSRAKGLSKNGSDIDLAILGDNISFRDLCALEAKFDELDLPYKVDLVDYNAITNMELKKHIDRVGVVL